jgi:exonuclease III
MTGPPKIYHDAQIVHTQLKGMLPNAAHRLHVLCCYLPWSGSKQLDTLDLAARYSTLQQILEDLATSQPDSHIIIAGDFNAKVGQEQALSIPAAAAILAQDQAYTITTQRQQLHTTLDAPGVQLNDLCCATNLINLTGLTPDDTPAAASYVKTSKQARIDHFLVSPAMVPHITGHSVCSHLLGSDHLPLQLNLCLRPTPPSQLESDDDTSPPPPPSQPKLPFIVPSSDATAIRKYQQLVSEPAAWQPLTDLAVDPGASPTSCCTASSRSSLMQRSLLAIG